MLDMIQICCKSIRVVFGPSRKGGRKIIGSELAELKVTFVLLSRCGTILRARLEKRLLSVLKRSVSMAA
jgi:hypothetical protein